MNTSDPYKNNILNEDFALLVRKILGGTFIVDLLGTYLSVYLILKKSNSAMGIYKYFLLNITVRSSANVVLLILKMGSKNFRSYFGFEKLGTFPKKSYEYRFFQKHLFGEIKLTFFKTCFFP